MPSIPYDRIIVLDHPLVRHKLSLLRSIDTNKKDFRELISELTTFLVIEATRNLAEKNVQVTTPLATCTCQQLANPDPIFYQVLRAGQGMMDAALQLIPTASIGTSGMYRDEETLQPVPYFHKPKELLAVEDIFVLDPMLATGGTLAETVTQIKATAKHLLRIRVLSVIAAPNGVQHLLQVHPDVTIYVCVVDERLDENGYIVPGLGDAGDRIFGTP